ncbi:transporter substrate-binding domain-containing protein [Legionella sp. km772]|uniref:transporter substrate-binding domain-containing protein n=1 Tax=Legionella sp. km772 TaxID=2498111 RepID=UPI000F8E1C0E|nr:transporter substrate-binding domain-containing protein [Legionella sp. km772]RUR13806.1 transporter substrate-binding domain-containing protein [Legionella sp. km772]
MTIKTLLVALLLSLLSLCSQAALNVGVLVFDPPYVYSPSEGFDIDLTRDICTSLKTECNLVFMNYHEFFPALDTGKIDFAIGGIFIQPSPKYIFSLPYIVGLGQFMTLRGSPYQKIADLKGTTIGVIKGNPSGSLFITYLQNSYPGFKINEYDSISDIVTALNNKSISAAFMRRSSVKYWTQNCTLFAELGPIDEIGFGIGIMSTPQNAALIERINQILMVMEQNNSYLNLYSTYFYNQ